jgi:hypothetical protein
MASHRSPNCPQITFSEAASKGRKVYEREHTHPAPKEAVAQDLGYSGINGRSLTLIGALRQYGILEGTSESLRVTDDAVSYYVLEEGPERDEAIGRMIFKPPFFESLRQAFGETLPSESTLKHHLIKEGFLPKAAEEVIGVYRENLELVKTLAKPSTVVSIPPSGDNTMAFAPAHTSSNLSLPSQTSPSIYSFSYPLSAEAKADLKIQGVVGEDELEMLRDHIEMTIKALKRTRKGKSELATQDENYVRPESA